MQASTCLRLNATNTACICSEASTINTFAGCVKLSCPLQDALLTTRIFKDACGAPVRDLGRSYTIQQIVLSTVSGLTVLLRMLSKTFSKDAEGGMNTLGADDLTILAAYVLLLPKMYLCGVLMTSAGLGRDVWTLSTHQIRDYAFYWYFAEPIYFAVASLTRISIILFFMRVFTGRGLRPTFVRGRLDFRHVLWGTLAFNVAMAAAFIVTALAQCAPVSFYWSQYDGGAQAGRCVDGSALVWSNAWVGIAMDAWMLCLPLSQIAGLNLSRWRRLLVGGMFGVGFLVAVISILRLHVLGGFASDNPTWDQLPVAVWSALEMHVGIVCACLPAIRVALARTLPEAASRVSKRFSSYIRLGTGTGAGTASSTHHCHHDQLAGGSIAVTSTTTTSDSTRKGRHSRAVSGSLGRAWYLGNGGRRTATVSSAAPEGSDMSLGVVTVVEEGTTTNGGGSPRRSQRQQPLDAKPLSKPLPLPHRSMTSFDDRMSAYAAAGGSCAEDSDSDRAMVCTWQAPHPGTQVELGSFTTGRPDDRRRLTPDFFAVSYPSVWSRGAS
ncbi:hypothetical protein RB595_003540 [Gaeumannomyces hyphopodioides]